MQDRVGPNRARLSIIPGMKDRVLGGIPHIITDVFKMLTKEAFMPKAANSFLFNLGPMLAFGPVFALFALHTALHGAWITRTTRDLFSDMDKVPKMLKKHKLAFLPHFHNRSAKEVRRAFRRSEEEEKKR